VNIAQRSAEEVILPPTEAVPVEYSERPPDVAAMFESTLKRAHEQFGCDVCALFPVNPITNAFLIPPVTYGAVLEEQGPQYEKPRTSGIAFHALRAGLLVVPDLMMEPEYESTFSARESIKAFMAVSICSDDQMTPFAVLYLDYRQPRQFSGPEQRDLVAFAAEAGKVFRIAWLLDRYRAVITIGKELNQGLDTTEKLFELLDSHIRRVVDVSSFVLAITNGPSAVLSTYYRGLNNRVAQDNLPSTGHWQEVLETREPKTVDDDAFPLPGLQPQQSASTHRSSIYLPLLLREAPIGAIAVQQLRPRAYTVDDVHILQLLSNQIAAAVNGIGVFETLDALQSFGESLSREDLGPSLTRSLTEQIQEVTKADVVVLYELAPTSSPSATPIIAGQLFHPERVDLAPRQISEFAQAVSRLEKPVWAEQGSELPDRLNIRAYNGDFGRREQIVSVAALPLRAGRNTVGALIVNYRSPQLFAGALKRLISGVAVYAANAIANDDAYRAQEQRRRKEREVLRRVDAELVKSTTLRSTLFTILAAANEIVGADTASVILQEDNRLRAISAIGRHASLSVKWSQRLDHDKGIALWVFKHRMPVRIDDVHSPFWREQFVDLGTETVSEMDVPLVDAGKVIGVLNFESTGKGKFSAEQLDFVELLAGQVVIAIKRAQLLDERERTVRELTALIKLSQDIDQLTLSKEIDQLNVNQISRVIIEFVVKHSPAESAALLFYNERTKMFDVKAAFNFEGTSVENSGVVANVSRHQRRFLGNPNESVDLANSYLINSQSVIAVPLGTRKPPGLLVVGMPRPDAFKSADIRLIDGAASIALIALNNADRYREQERERLDVLQRVVQRTDDPGEVLKELVRAALMVTRANRSDIDLLENGKRVKTYYCEMDENNDATDVTEVDLIKTPRALVRSIMQHVAETGEAYWTVGDAQADRWYQGIATIHSELAVRMDVGSGVHLVLNVESVNPDFFGDYEARLLQRFAESALPIFRIARNRERAERERARFEMLLRAGQSLGKVTRDVGEACDIVADEAARECRCLAVVRTLDYQTMEFEARAYAGEGCPPFPRVPLREGFYGRLYETRATQRVRDYHNPRDGDPEIKPSNPQARSYIATPVGYQQIFYGAIGMSRVEPDYFSDDDQKIIEGLAQLLGITLHRLESTRTLNDLQQGKKQTEIVASIGRASFEIAHRLGNDLGLVATRAKRIRLAVEQNNHRRFDLELNEIVKEVKSVLELTTDLTEKVKEFREAEPVLATVKQLLDDVRVLNRKPSNIIINRDIPDDIAPVKTGLDHAVAVLTNLVSNAFEAMRDQGGGTLTIKARNGERHVQIEVADTGPGIDPKIQAKIFEFLYSSKGGTGFGLWSAKQRAIVNGGNLVLESSSTEGAVFLYTIPRADRDEGTFNAQRIS
jgi:GAF domain-containing protein